MGRRADILVAQGAGAPCYAGAGTNYLVQANNGADYLIYVDASTDVAFRKSTDGGKTWSLPTTIYAGTVTNLAVWYDRWTGLTSDYIHLAYNQTGDSDTLYRTIDTGSSDALSTQTVIHAGASAVQSGSAVSITRTVGGNVLCRTTIDAGAEGGFYRLPNANVPNGAWDAARTIDEALATTDQFILLPDLTAADTNDAIMLFWDASANEISRKLYDDSGNSWSETSIGTSFSDVTANNTHPHWSAAVDLANSQIILIAWNGVDTANADLQCWTITNSAITAKTDVVTNSTDDQGLCGISIDTSTGYWWALYGGKSDGSETWTATNYLYCKVSQDGGTTWGAETQMSTIYTYLRTVYVHPRFTGQYRFVWLPNAWPDLRINVDMTERRAGYLMGV